MVLGIRDILAKVTLGHQKESMSQSISNENFYLVDHVVDLACQVPVKTDHYAMIFSKSGTCLKTSGRFEFTIEPKTLHFITPGMIHAYSKTTPDLDLTMVLFKRSFIAGSFIKEDVFDQLVELSPLIAPYFPLSDERSATFEQLLTSIRSEFGESKPFGAQFLKLLTIQMLYEMNRTCEECLIHSPRRLSRQYQLVSAYRKLIDERFLEIRTVKEFADLLSVTTKQLGRVVLDETGHSALQLIHNRVFLEAKYMLSGTPMSIKQIAYHLGFDTGSHFGRFFKLCSGMNPSEYKIDKNIDGIHIQ